MAKFKPAKPKTVKTPPVRGGLPCVILVILAIIFVMAVIVLVMKYAG